MRAGLALSPVFQLRCNVSPSQRRQGAARNPCFSLERLQTPELSLSSLHDIWNGLCLSVFPFLLSDIKTISELFRELNKALLNKRKYLLLFSSVLQVVCDRDTDCGFFSSFIMDMFFPLWGERFHLQVLSSVCDLATYADLAFPPSVANFGGCHKRSLHFSTFTLHQCPVQLCSARLRKRCHYCSVSIRICTWGGTWGLSGVAAATGTKLSGHAWPLPRAASGQACC